MFVIPRKFLPVALAVASATSLLATPANPSFATDVRPILQAKCAPCHGATPQGKFDVRSPEAILKGGASGPAVLPGVAEKSLLIAKVVTKQMPPGPNKLTDAEIDKIRGWIDLTLPAEAKLAGPQVTEREVLSILQARCVRCHGGLAKQGGLDLRTMESRLKGGKSGPALVPGKPEASPMYTRVAAGQMPPDKMAKDLAIELATDGETEKIRAWIAAGAPGPQPEISTAPVVKEDDRKFWSFQPPVRPSVPQVKNQALVRNPIDAFLLQKLEEKKLKFSPEASRLALMRRVDLDLVGMVPSKAEIDEYLADKSPNAYEKLVDRLLASQHYGERWGQHWLDIAGYADSEGFGQDDGVRPFAWRYRDYVIRSLNTDKPYTQFLTEQIAGDELSDDWKKLKGKAADLALVDRIAATGFLRTTPDQTNSNERALINERMNIVADEVEVLTSSVMGLSVGCARCHNHKYDPIPQRDYYRLSSILQAAYNPYEWKPPNQREFDLATEAERKDVSAHNGPLEAEIKKLQDQIDKESETFKLQLITERLAEVPEVDREAVRATALLKPAQRNEAQKALADKYDIVAKISSNDLQDKYPDLKNKVKTLQAEVTTVRGKLKPKPNVRILTDNEEPSVSYLQRRGDPVDYGESVDAGVPTVLQNAALKPYEIVSPFPGATGRRLALAKWLTQPNHPLTARVAVNQLWMRHFGRGIVATVNNFGHAGAAPSNQELLDWLATEFVDKGWSMKQMHRLMVTSTAYRQSSAMSPELSAADPDNVLVSRMPLRRMDAETLYDSLVTAAGRMDPALFGRFQDVSVTADKEVIVKADKSGFRRAIYVLHRRQTPMSLLDAFDEPAMTPNCPQRRQSNVATQALHMMNGSMTWELAQYMAGRVIEESDGIRAKQVESVYLRAYSRRPSAEETKLGVEAIEEFRKQWPERLAADASPAPRNDQANWLAVANFCHAVLNSAEFSFID